jgi:hypothetical protein
MASPSPEIAIKPNQYVNISPNTDEGLLQTEKPFG